MIAQGGQMKEDDMRKNRWQIGVGLLVLAAIVRGTAQAARRPSADVATESSLRVRVSPVFQEVVAGVEGVADIYVTMPTASIPPRCA
jgi:hypothetical protein